MPIICGSKSIMTETGAFPNLQATDAPLTEDIVATGGEKTENDESFFAPFPPESEVVFAQALKPSSEEQGAGSDGSWSEGGLFEAGPGTEYTYHDKEDDEDPQAKDGMEVTFSLKESEHFHVLANKVPGSICTEEESVVEGPLLWRMDPKNSWSDWTIVVSCDDVNRGTLSTSFHVHKALLASGPRRSRYFRRLFRTDETADQPSKTSEIKLSFLSAQAFPLFLDLIYDQTVEVAHADENIKRHAVALYQLADKYQVASLVNEIQLHFIPKIGLGDACRYYEDAVAFDPPIESFLNHIMKLCTNNVLAIEPDSPLLRALEPKFLLGILETERRRRETRVTAGAEALLVSRHLSKLIVSYVAYCDDEYVPLNDQTLEELTRKEYIPSIDFEVVLDWAKKIVRRMEVSQDNQSDPALNLQLRCLDTIKGNISKVNLDDPHSEYRDFLKSLPAETAVDAVLELTSLRQRGQQDLMKKEADLLAERNASLESTGKQQAAEIHSLLVEHGELLEELGRFELLTPSVGKKSSLKKVPTPLHDSDLPRGVNVPPDDGGYLHCAGRPLFTLCPREPSPSSSV